MGAVNQVQQGMQQAGQTAAQGTQFQGGTLAGTNLSAYQNPYEQQVVQQSLADINRQQQMAMNQLGAQAQGQGAFGGSRQGVAEAELARNYGDIAARTASGLRQQGFMNAMQYGQQDIQNRLAAERQRLAAGGQLAGISGQGYGMVTDLLGRVQQAGAGARGLQQSALDAGQQQYQQYMNLPYQQAALLGSVLPGLRTGAGTQTSSQTPGTLQYLTAIGNIAGAFS